MFDSLFLALGLDVVYADAPAPGLPCIIYGAGEQANRAGCLCMVHTPAAWSTSSADLAAWPSFEGLPVPPSPAAAAGGDAVLPFDLVAGAFHFLTLAFEREGLATSRRLHADSVFATYRIRQDIVDAYLELLWTRLQRSTGIPARSRRPAHEPNGFAVALTHDVDFLPRGPFDNFVQGAKTLARHAVRQRDPLQAARAGFGFVKAMASGRDPYGCVPDIIAREVALGVRSSFQVAVARRHPADVNYDVADERTRAYLRCIPEKGFDLCLHGSYRSTERVSWYCEEVECLADCLVRPRGSRQHFLSFDYDTLFLAQEACGIRYDMSVGFPDATGPRAGFSYPYFPYCMRDERPYDVLEIPLAIMDVTLQSYLRLDPGAAQDLVDSELEKLNHKRGAVSVVWHPIVFGGARDPGYAEVYWHLVQRTLALGGLATDGRTLHDAWRKRARSFASFASLTH